MTTVKKHKHAIKSSALLSQFVSISLLIVFFTWVGCNSHENKNSMPENELKDSSENEAMTMHENKPGEVLVVSTGMNFNVADTIYSGWNKVTYKNESPDTHFLVFEKYPGGKNIDDAKNEVVNVFQRAMDSITAGKQQEGMAIFGDLPKWFNDVQISGGTGLVSPGKTAHTTVKLDPGLYLIECYVKMPNGKFHSAMGMLDQIIVKQENSGGSPPKPTDHIEVSGAEGFTLQEIPTAGEQVFEVHFKDQKVHENFVGHDVHLVHLLDESDMSKLESWINWLDPKGLISPAPQGFEFLGGLQEMPAGSTGYFTAYLVPGNYVIISEVPNPYKKHLLKTFTVGAD